MAAPSKRCRRGCSRSRHEMNSQVYLIIGTKSQVYNFRLNRSTEMKLRGIAMLRGQDRGHQEINAEPSLNNSSKILFYSAYILPYTSVIHAFYVALKVGDFEKNRSLRAPKSYLIRNLTCSVRLSGLRRRFGLDSAAHKHEIK